MAGQSKSDDPNIAKKSLFPEVSHVIIFKLLYLTKFDKNMIGGRVIYFFIKTSIIFNEIMFLSKTNNLLGHFRAFFMYFIVS